jgi:hypothetical protein
MYLLMAVSTRPPRLEFAHDGANPTLETIEYVRAILRAAETPISRNEILRKLAAWGHSTTRRTLNAAIAFLGADGNVAEGSKGLIWLSEPSAKLAEAVRHAVPLR